MQDLKLVSNCLGAALAALLLLSGAGAEAAPALRSSAATASEREPFIGRQWTYQQSAPGMTAKGVFKAEHAGKPIDFYALRSGCRQRDDIWCDVNVLALGPGYLGNREMPQNNLLRVHAGDGDGDFLLALMSFQIPAEGLTPAVLARLELGRTMPSCHAAIELPGGRTQFEYGSWTLRAVYSPASGRYMAWLEGSGGDAGYLWILHTFVTVDASCTILSREDWMADMTDDITIEPPCNDPIADTSQWLKIDDKGRVSGHAPRATRCRTFSLHRL
jgi:hypothetical protein